MMNYQTALAPILAGLGGLWMLASGAMMHRRWGLMPMHGRWEMGHMMWGQEIVVAIGGGWLALLPHPVPEK
jgi:hypothetical protein